MVSLLGERLFDNVWRFRRYIIFLRQSSSLSLSLFLSSFFKTDRERERERERASRAVPLRMFLWSPVRLYWTSGRDWRVSIIFYFVGIKGNLQLYGLRGCSLPRNIQSRIYERSRNFLVSSVRRSILLSFATFQPFVRTRFIIFPIHT